MKLIVSRSAAADFERLYEFLAADYAAAAKRALSALSAAIDSLAVFPERGRPQESGGLRELIVPFGRSSYVVRYLHDMLREEVIIIRLWHGREARE